MLQISGKQIPDWVEGEVLPPYKPADPNRSIFAFEAKDNKQFEPITNATAMAIKDQLKLIYYFGYDKLKEPLVELFDIENDPEELENLYHPDSITAKNLLDELITKIEESNQRYED
jgi:arylsulfatase A-like enzyme